VDDRYDCANVSVTVTSHVTHLPCWLRGPAVEHRSLADVLSLSYARPVADG